MLRPLRSGFACLLLAALAVEGAAGPLQEEASPEPLDGAQVESIGARLQRLVRRESPPFDDASKHPWEHLALIGRGEDVYVRPEGDESSTSLRVAAWVEAARSGLRASRLNQLALADAELRGLGVDAAARWDWLSDVLNDAFEDKLTVGSRKAGETGVPHLANAEIELALVSARMAADAGDDDGARRLVSKAESLLHRVHGKPARALLASVIAWAEADTARRLEGGDASEALAFPPGDYRPGMLLTLVEGKPKIWADMHKGKDDSPKHRLARIREDGGWRTYMAAKEREDWELKRRDYVIRGEGWFAAPAGRYRLLVKGDDGALVFLDGALVLDSWHGATAGRVLGAELELDGRPHQLRAYVWDYIGGMDFQLYLQRPDGQGWRNAPLDLHLDPEMARAAGL